jgi:hypothetical protein
MHRAMRASVATTVFAFTAIACATSPRGGSQESDVATVSDADGIRSWLSGESHAEDGRPNYFIQMADTQLGMSEYSLLALYFDASWRDDQ